MTDLFETPENLPAEVLQIIDEFNSTWPTYKNCQNLVSDLKKIGYSCQYDLDFQPYNLQKIK